MIKNALVACNPQLHLEGKIYRDATQKLSSDLSSYLMIAVPQLLDGEFDKGLFSFELEQRLHTPELRHEFSAATHNVLRVSEFDNLADRRHALDLTQDFGGSAQYLSQYFENVDSVKHDIGRAENCLRRFPDAQNITQFSSPMAQLNLPSNHYGFIYIGELEALKLGQQQFSKALDKLADALSDDGVLLVSLKNRLRLSKWLNVDRHEYDPPTPYSELYDNEGSALFSLDELQTLLGLKNFNYCHINASFSAQGKLSNLFSIDYLNNGTHVANHFYRIGSVANSNLSEYMMYKALGADAQRLADYASRYVIFCGKGKPHNGALYHNDFTHFAGTSRLPQWRTITTKPCGESSVFKTHCHDQALEESAGLLSQNIAPQKFYSGPLLLDQWLHALRDKDAPQFETLVVAYYAWLSEQQKQSNFADFGYDLLPFNIVRDENADDYHIIDAEWRVNTQISATFILFRALLWLSFENRALMADFAEHWGFESVGDFVRHYLSVATGDSDLASGNSKKLEGFVDLEEQLQAEISHEFNAKSVHLTMHHGFRGTTKLSQTTPLCQVTWADQDDNFEQANAVYEQWQGSAEKQQVRLHLPAYNSAKQRLRVDPIDKAGLFEFDSIELLDSDNQLLWQLSDSESIAQQAILHNLEWSKKPTNEKQDKPGCFIALNDDPFLVFDLSGVDKLDLARTVHLSLSLTFEPNYDRAMDTLRKVVANQTQSITALGNKAHETRAEIDILNAKLAHTEAERQHLSSRTAEMQALIEHNHQLQQALARTPRARLMRLLKRGLTKLGLLK